ncbi:neurotensin receptor type 1 [Xenopus tropicalis]|uniref:Neurotensin receptor type 1 n=1 Tax=Xenopus tropicalis TaxID=8364 RepID=A0A8J1IXW7_XENTR|nr:neurotensin receptor type 1 [Xenopus tropicalis]
MRFNATPRLSQAGGPLYPDAQELLFPSNLSNVSDPLPKPIMSEDELDVNTDIYSKSLVTVIYLSLFLVGSTGNSITAYTLVRKKSLQNLQSTVHYHLASLALSDLLILLLSMPIELYNFIWVHHPWAFGNSVCKGYYFLRDACTYATALNIASLSAERYLAMCHPFKAKSIMSRSRTKKLISFIWVASLLLAAPMIFTMGQIYGLGTEHPNNLICTRIVEMSTFKTVIQVTNVCTQFLSVGRGNICIIVSTAIIIALFCFPPFIPSFPPFPGVVVIAFVVCWLPYHVRRLMFCYVPEEMWSDELNDFYHYFYMLTNVLFYVSSTVNPILYNLVSANFRQIFVSTLSFLCPPWKRKKKRPAFTRKSNSISSTNHTFSTQITRETPY